MDNCSSFNLALSQVLEHFLALCHVSAEQCSVMKGASQENISIERREKLASSEQAAAQQCYRDNGTMKQYSRLNDIFATSRN